MVRVGGQDRLAPASPQEEWLQRVARGDRAAFERLYASVSGTLFGICVHMLKDRREAEDLLQEVFVAVWRNAWQYDASRASAMSWLTTIARHRAIDRLRESSPIDPNGSLDGLGLLLDPDPTPDEHSEARSERSRLDDCMDQLGERPRALIHTAFFEGLSYRELAEREGQALGSVKTWIRRGLLQLKACLEP